MQVKLIDDSSIRPTSLTSSPFDGVYNPFRYQLTDEHDTAQRPANRDEDEANAEMVHGQRLSLVFLFRSRLSRTLNALSNPG